MRIDVKKKKEEEDIKWRCKFVFGCECVQDNGDKDCDDFNYEVDKDKNNDNQGNKSNL